MRALVVAALVAAPALAACLASEPAPAALSAGEVAGLLSGPVSTDVLHEITTITTSEGDLEADVWRPDTDARVPVILWVSPYNNPLENERGGKDPANASWVSLRLLDWIKATLVPRGYAFANVDVLGTRHSGGCMGISDATERRSTAQAVEAFAAMPWSNGRVGMIGKSYPAKTAFGAALEKPAGLATIVPLDSVTSQYGYHFMNGVQYWANTRTQDSYLLTDSATPPDRVDPAVLARYPERFPCMPEHVVAGFDPRGDSSPRWADRDFRPHAKEIEASVLYVMGLQDWNVKPDHVLGWYNEIEAPKMALLTQMGHDYPDNMRWDPARYGNYTEWYLLLHRWFDHWLKGIDTGLLDELAREGDVVLQGSDGKWRRDRSFPPLDASLVSLHPTADGALAEAPGRGEATYAEPRGCTRSAPPYDPPALPSGPGLPQPASLVPNVEACADPGTNVTFWTAPYAGGLRVVGAPRVRLAVATTSAVTTYLAVALAEVDANGTAREFTWGYYDGAHRNGLGAFEPTTPGERFEVEFDLYPVDHVLARGSSLALVLRGDGPFVRANQNGGEQTVFLEGTSLTIPTKPLDPFFEVPPIETLPGIYEWPHRPE